MGRRTFGSIRQLPSGRWHARFRDRDGQQRSAPQTFAAKADAGRWLSRTQADIERGESAARTSWISAQVSNSMLSGFQSSSLFNVQFLSEG